MQRALPRAMKSLMTPIWWIAVLLFAVLAFAAVTWVVMIDRNSALRRAEARTQSLSRIFVDHAERSIEDGDKLITAITPDVRAWDGRDAAASRKLHEAMKALMFGSPHLSAAWIVDARGATVIDSRTFPSTAIDSAHRDYFRRHLANASDPVIAGRELGSVSGRDRFTLSRAVRDDSGRLRFVIVVGMYSSYFASLYAEVANWPQAGAGLFLRSGDGVIALAGLPTQPGGQTGPLEDIVRKLPSEPSGQMELEADGDSRLVGWHASPKFPGIYAVTSHSVKIALGGWRWRAILISMLALAATTVFAALGFLATRLDRAKESAERNALLLREVHHRVKNNLAIVLSMMNRAVRDTRESTARDQLQRVAAQVSGIATLYDQMQGVKAGDAIEINEILVRVCEALQSSTGCRVEFVRASAIDCSADRATSLLIVVNELVTNAIKHAAGCVTVACREPEPHVVELTVSDDGDGLPHDFDIDGNPGFGLRLVCHLVRSSEGSITVASAKPATFKVRLPLV